MNTGHLPGEYYENKNKRINVPINKVKRNQKKSVVDFFYKPQAVVKEPENNLNRDLNKYEKMNKTDIVNYYYEFINKDCIEI